MLNNTERRIINVVRKHDLISRIEIVEKLGVSKPVVSINVKKLIEKGFIREVENYKGPLKSFGRKRIGLSFIPNCMHVIGIDVGGTKLEGIIGDLDGNILKGVRYPTKDINNKEELLKTIYRAIEELMNASDKDILGIGIGVPGTVDAKNEVVEYMPAFKLEHVDLETPIEKRFNLPTFIENDVTLDAYAESRIGAGKNNKNLFLVSIGTGVGGGTIINGKIYTGANGKAGEIGEMITDWEREKNARGKSSFGPLELWFSGSSLEKRLSNLGVESVREGFALLGKDKRVTEMIKTGIEHLGVAISNLIFLLNPEVIIIKGGIGYNQFDRIMKFMMPIIKNIVPDGILDKIDFKRGEFNRFGVAIGGVFLVEKEVLRI